MYEYVTTGVKEAMSPEVSGTRREDNTVPGTEGHWRLFFALRADATEPTIKPPPAKIPTTIEIPAQLDPEPEVVTTRAGIGSAAASLAVTATIIVRTRKY